MAKSQKPNGQNRMAKTEHFTHDTNTWRDRHPEKVKERWGQNTNGQKPKHKWPKQNSLHMTPITVSPLQSGSYTPKLSLYLYYVPLIN